MRVSERRSKQFGYLTCFDRSVLTFARSALTSSLFQSRLHCTMSRTKIDRRVVLKSILTSAAVTAGTLTAFADEPQQTVVSRLKFDSPQMQTWKVGLILKTPVNCTNVLATFPVPVSWPEQKVTLKSKNIDPLVTRWQFRDVASNGKQVVLGMNAVPAGSTVQCTMEFEIERSRILPLEKTDDLVIPKRIDRSLRLYIGNSPYIDTSNSRIKKAWKEIAAMDADNDWQRVEQIYDYVRAKVQYVEGSIKNASVALREGKGDCEEMTSLFVALCRNARVPARIVWVPDHCYPEFYLEDADGNGHWIPCQAAGTRQFGRMDEYRPVLQKGDRFKVPEKRTPIRYISEFFKCDRKGKRNPDPMFIRERIEQ